MRRTTRQSKLWRTIRVMALLVAYTMPLACGSSSPTAPNPPSAPPSTTTPSLPATFTGVWRANAKAVTCTLRIPAPCEPERSLTFVLRVTAGGPGYLGTFEIEEGLSLAVVISVIGESQPDGSVLFMGAHGVSRDVMVAVQRLLVKLDGAAGLSGDMELRQLVTGTERRTTGYVLSASYQPMLPQSGTNLSGTWSGVSVIRACSGYCPAYRTVGQQVLVSLTIGQSGTAVNGQMQLSILSCSGCWVPFSGSMSDDRLTLSGPMISRDSPSGDRTLHLESLEGSLDYISRLVGSFVYAADSRIAISPFNVSYRLECEILWLKRD